MPNEVLANEVLAPLPEVALSEHDYRAFCAALEASARGRAFLAEYARRNRHANTEVLLAAIDRLETLVRSQAATTEADRIRQELRALLAAMRAAQPAIDASAAAIKAAKLAAMIGFVQHRIESIVANQPSPLPAEVAALVMPDEATADVRSHLAVVPRADEPELPIPSPAAQGPAIALVAEAVPPELQPAPEPKPVQTIQEAPQPVLEMPQPIAEPEPPQPAAEPIAPARSTAAIMPEVNLFDSAPAKPAVDAPVVEEAAAQPAVIETVVVATVALEPAAIETVIATMIELPQAELVEEAFATPPAPAALAADAVAPLTPLIPAQAGIQNSKRGSEDFGTGSPLARGRADDSARPETIETLPADDPLALIMALSEAERIALFT